MPDQVSIQTSFFSNRQIWVILKSTDQFNYDDWQSQRIDQKSSIFQKFVETSHIPTILAFWDTNQNIPAGYYFGEEYPLGNLNINFWLTLSPNATNGDIADALAAIWTRGAGASGNDGQVQKEGIENALPNSGKLVDYLLNLGSVQTTTFKSIFPLINITGAPQWFNDLLNIITGKGLLGLIFWIVVLILITAKLTLSKKRSILLWILFIVAGYMTYDAYSYRSSLLQAKQVK